MASGINLNPMGAKRSPMEAGLAGRQEESAPQQAALTPDMIAAAANNLNNPLTHMFQGHLPPYSQ